MSKPDEALTESLTADEAFDLLSHAERRRALTVLRESDGAVTLGELAAETVARDESLDPDEVPTDQRERTAAALHHSHLPRLEGANVVEYDPQESAVALTGTAEELDPFFEIIQPDEASD